jgi:non-heme chloroperoxidase
MHTRRSWALAPMTAGRALLSVARMTTALREYEVRGGDGTLLRARDWGNPDGLPILFVHGWSQCDLCWSAQVESDLADRFRLVTFDCRGHGMSEKPLDGGAYADGRLWADDVAAVIDAAQLERPVLVAWSYGGFVISDYVRTYGDAGIAGIDLVGGAVLLRPPTFDHIGPGFLENAPEASLPDLGTNIAAIRRFLHACSAHPLNDDLHTRALAWNMVVPPAVRGALIAREIDGTDVLSSLTVPVLATHGLEDTIVLPSMSEYTLAHCPTSTASWYDGVGHMPFAEAPERFNRELAAFVARASMADAERPEGGRPRAGDVMRDRPQAVPPGLQRAGANPAGEAEAVGSSEI